MSKFLKIFVIFLIGFSFAGVTLKAQAACHATYKYYCKVIPSHWAHGRWYPAQKICYKAKYQCPSGTVSCKTIPAHWRYGQFYPTQRVCW